MKTHAIRSDFDLRFLGFRVSIYGLGFSGFRVLGVVLILLAIC